MRRCARPPFVASSPRRRRSRRWASSTACSTLVRAKRRDGSDEHELIIVDLPATGHALALAQIPASLLRVIPTGPIANAVREGLDLLTDPARTGAIVVTLPETLPVSEALELVQGIEPTTSRSRRSS